MKYESRIIKSKKYVMDVSSTCHNFLNSGVERVVRKIAENAQKTLDKDVEFICFDHENKMFRKLNNEEYDCILNWEPRNFNKEQKDSTILKLFHRIEKIFGITQKKRIKEDIVLLDISGNYYFSAEVAFDQERAKYVNHLFSKKIVKSLCLFYDFIPWISVELSPYAGVFYNTLFALRNSDCVICISRHVAYQYKKWLEIGCIQQRVEYMHLGVDSKLFVLKKIATQGKIKTILSVTLGENRKNSDRILDAIINLQSMGIRFNFIFAGHLSRSSCIFREKIEKAISAGVSITIYDEIPDNDLISLYNSSDFTLFPSLEEGFGLPILESLSCGKPCITSNIDPMKEIAETYGGCILVDPYDSKSIEEAIYNLLTKDDLLINLEKSILFGKINTWEIFTTKYLNILMEL
jgi:glycosyltransferase involved in cell wall biosynthesis